MAAQSSVREVSLGMGSRGVFSLPVENDTATPVSVGAASLGLRRQASLSSTRAHYLQEGELARKGTRIRGRTAGALIGAVVFGAVGLAGGYAIDNAERSQGTRIGSATLGGAAGGVLIGAVLGGAVGWLLER